MDLISLKKVLFIIFSIPNIMNCNAQGLNTNLTNNLMAIHLNTSTSPYHFIESNVHETTRIKLSKNHADCFLLTFEIPEQSSISSDLDLLSFQIQDNGYIFNAIPFMKIGMTQNKNGWYVDRYYIDKKGATKNIRYKIYDDIGYGGKYTIIVGKYCMGIAHDTPDKKWDFTPLFFGLDSNLGSDGETNYKDAFFKQVGTDSIEPQIIGYGPLKKANLSVFMFLGQEDGVSTSKISTLLKLLEMLQNNISERHIIEDKKPVLVVNKKIENKNIFIYPNPAFNEITVITPLKEKAPILLEIKDMNGKVVYKEKYLQLSTNKHIVLTNNLSPGIYIVTIQSEQFNEKVKLIINN